MDSVDEEMNCMVMGLAFLRTGQLELPLQYVKG
jgi:hypothetical protein